MTFNPTAEWWTNFLERRNGEGYRTMAKRFRIMIEVDTDIPRADVNEHALEMVRNFQAAWNPVLIATEQLLPSETVLFDQRKK